MSIKFDGKKAQDLTDDDIEMVLDEPAETRRQVHYAHCLLLDAGNPAVILAAHYSKGMSSIIVQDTKRTELRLRGAAGVDIRVAFANRAGDQDSTGPVIMSVAGTEHKLLLEYEEGGSILYAAPVEKDRNGK